ncbi:recombinase family protein [Sphingobium sp. LB126]|nr:recombinase family protein [Sphingobium sp. LB126]
MARPRAKTTGRRSTRSGTAAADNKAVLYFRVSSTDQEREGFSLPAQLKFLREYAAINDIQIVGEYLDVESAKKAGRTEFQNMVAFLRRHTSVRSILVEKTDRLYRNFKDYVTLDELDVVIHLAKEGEIISRESRSSEKFVHAIKVLMAKNYIDNLSEEARKGMTEKAAQGYWPTLAPLGYRNARDDSGRKVIVIDPEVAPRVKRLFEYASTGNFSMNKLAEIGRDLGLMYRRSGKPIRTSTLIYVLRNRLYGGSYDWNGKIYQGRHEPIITHELWEAVQAVIDGREGANIRVNPKDFTYTGLMKCGHCGCAIVAEVKKKKYIYYHCTGYKGKCPEPYVRQEVMDEHFEQLLRRIRLDETVFDLVRTALKESHADERREHEEARTRLLAEAAQLQERLDLIYLDKIERRISAAYHDRIVVPWRDQRARVIRNLEHLNAVDDAYIDDGVALIELATNAHEGFASTPPKHKRLALNLLLSNCTWANGGLDAKFNQPFDMLADLSAAALFGGRAESAKSAAPADLVTPTGIEPVFQP